jgi:hypothetical protein
MKTFIGNEALLYALLPDNNIKIVKESKRLPYYNIRETPPMVMELEIELNGSKENIQLYTCPMPNIALSSNPTTRLTNLEFDYYMNPPENSIIIYDRWIFERYIDFIFKQYGISELNKLINRYKEKNIKVVFNFAFFEPTEYESLNYFLINYNYGFDCIKITDYELFDDYNNFVFAKIFNLFHVIADLSSFKINEYFRTKNIPNLYNLFSIEEINNPEKIYSHLTLKPRPHRINVINKLYDLDIVEYGYCTINKIMYSEYDEKKKTGSVYSTDNSLMQNKWLHGYFKNMDYRGYEYYLQKMEDALGTDFWSHLRHYLEHKEYKKIREDKIPINKIEENVVD